MSRDAELRDDEGHVWSFNNLTMGHWLEGHAPGAEAAGAFLNEHAVALFRAGKDAEAAMVRDLAKKMLADVVPKLKAKAAEHERDFPPGGPPSKRPK